MRVAAVQIATRVADPDANIESCSRLSLRAVGEGARFIALPEFFNTGVAFEPRLVGAIETLDGKAARFLAEFSKSHDVVLGGSFLCRLPDGSVRNRYLCFASGALVGQHDKDLPTMWENAFYEGGDAADVGVLGTYEGTRIGAAVCWEFMRTQTVRRLRSRVDLVMGGSCWWSVPTNFPNWLQRASEPENANNALAAVQDTARLIGVPILHASHSGSVECPMPGLPIRYRGYFEGHAAIVDAHGKVLAHRSASEGEGFVLADVSLGARPTSEDIPAGYWLRDRGAVATFAWHHQRWLGKRWYERHVRQKCN